MSGWDWDGLARSIDLLNAAISQEVRVGDARVVILNRDSARYVRDAAEAWVKDYGKPTKRSTLDGILAWLDEAPEDWPWTGADIAAMIREGCPDWQSPGGASKAPPLAGDGRTTLELWASRGLFPGDMINEEGDLLGLDGRLRERGTIIIRKDQAARAAVFGWMLHEGYLPSAQSPDHVVVQR